MTNQCGVCGKIVEEARSALAAGRTDEGVGRVCPHCKKVYCLQCYRNLLGKQTSDPFRCTCGNLSRTLTYLGTSGAELRELAAMYKDQYGMQQLAMAARQIHGPLVEVVFTQANTELLLVFSDGAVLPPQPPKDKHDIRFRILAHECQTHKQAYQSAGFSKTPPYQLFDLSEFLSASGFKNSNAENIRAPLKLRADGSQVSGTRQNDLIEWEDGSTTPSLSLSLPKKKWWEFWK